MTRLKALVYGVAIACACANAQVPEVSLTWSGGAVEVVAPLKLTVRDVRILGLALGDIEGWAYPGLNVENGKLVGGVGLFKRIGGNTNASLYAGFRLHFEPARRPSARFALAGSWVW